MIRCYQLRLEIMMPYTYIFSLYQAVHAPYIFKLHTHEGHIFFFELLAPKKGSGTTMICMYEYITCTLRYLFLVVRSYAIQCVILYCQIFIALFLKQSIYKIMRSTHYIISPSRNKLRGFLYPQTSKAFF